jgi:flagellar biosynthetic protein FliP
MSGRRLVCSSVLSVVVLCGLSTVQAIAQSTQDAPAPFLNSNPTSSANPDVPWSSTSNPNDALRNLTTSLGNGAGKLGGNSAGATAKAGAPTSGIQITGLGNSSAPWTIVVLLTLLGLIPSLMICVTPFARLLVVFHFLRQALGLQTTPSNQTLIGLSMVLTFFIMQPVGEQINHDALVPLENGKISAFDAVNRGAEPLRHFMAHYVREKDAALFLDIAHVPRPRTVDDIPMRVMMPAYIVSELRAGFQIGAVLFLPFLVVDIVVASITNAVGMMQLPPVVISTPLKLMLFLMVDGWHLLIAALVRSFS